MPRNTVIVQTVANGWLVEVSGRRTYSKVYIDKHKLIEDLPEMIEEPAPEPEPYRSIPGQDSFG